LNHAFFQSFSSSAHMAFPGAHSDLIPLLEVNWWHDVALKTFQTADVLDEFTDFSEFFQELYTHFATANPWFIYPDVRPTLDQWRGLGIQMGVISNFDSRLYAVLEALDLAQFFTSVTVSTEVGSAKPDRKFFETALKKHQCAPQNALHIGDSLKADYQGATSVGIPAILLSRSVNQDQSLMPESGAITRQLSLLNIVLNQ
ncbi:MAG: HAD-IA family hydrolase, partial [Microcoleaceae cyanobacterium]